MTTSLTCRRRRRATASAPAPAVVYQLWYDLEPHTTGADGDIDVKDVQFVFGRFGSE